MLVSMMHIHTSSDHAFGGDTNVLRHTEIKISSSPLDRSITPLQQSHKTANIFTVTMKIVYSLILSELRISDSRTSLFSPMTFFLNPVFRFL